MSSTPYIIEKKKKKKNLPILSLWKWVILVSYKKLQPFYIANCDCLFVIFLLDLQFFLYHS